jgi:hypothetical protein
LLSLRDLEDEGAPAPGGGRLAGQCIQLPQRQLACLCCVFSVRVVSSHLVSIVKGLGIARSRAFATDMSHVSRFCFIRLTEVKVNMEAADLLLFPTSTTTTLHTKQSGFLHTNLQDGEWREMRLTFETAFGTADDCK